MHVVEGFVDLVQWLPVSDKLVNLELSVHIILHKSRQLGTTLHASESATTPRSLQIGSGQLAVQKGAKRRAG